MIIRQDLCVGCGRCQPFCPAGAISFAELKSTVDQVTCLECGTCLRVGICPVHAIEEHPQVYEYPRAIRKFFSDPASTHKATGIQGRGTEESKTNDVTLRVGPDKVGIGIEIGRPTLGASLRELQKLTQTLAAKGIREIEPHNPVHSLIEDPATGTLKPELLGERVLSAIIEIQVKRVRLREVLQTVKEVAREMESVLCLDVFTILDPGLEIPRDVLDVIESEGFSWRPNAKVNMGLGRAWE